MNPTALNDLVHRIVGQRYRLDALIGVGTVSAVFAAFDVVENQRVAVKVFDDALNGDEALVDRLLDAAAGAAALRHPNIARVYDFGNDEGVYIVSELCEGGSLADLLDGGNQLSASQALVMALECARALHHGHSSGAVHRGMHPGNILFTGDQRVRVSDYGLASVLAEAPVSEVGHALDSVRYASPEQARGRPVRESSDLYSLALLVSESVSGEPPPTTETVVGTLMERAESPAHLSADLGELFGPLERCGRVDPDQRPEAEELSIALLATAETMSRPAAFPLVGLVDPVSGMAITDSSTSANSSDVGFAPALEASDSLGAVESSEVEASAEVDDTDDFNVDVLGDLDDLDALDAFSAADDEPLSSDTLFEGDDSFEDRMVVADPIPHLRAVDDETAERSGVMVGSLENLEEAEPVFAAVPGADDGPALDVPDQPVAPRSTAIAYEEHADDADDRLPWWPLLLLVVVVAAAIAAGIYLAGSARSSETAEVPDVLGLSLDEVEDAIDGRGWQLQVLEARRDGSVVGDVVEQEPVAGIELDRENTFTVTVSLGNEMVEIPSDIVGLTVEQAQSRLGSVGLAVGDLAQENSEALAAGLVIGLDEPTTQKPSGQGVALRVSLGPEDRAVPAGLVGSTISDATGLLTGLRLQAVEEPLFDPEIPVGTVIDSLPREGERLPADSQVTLFVSAGPEPVVMPDIIGLPLAEVYDAYEELGLIVIDTEGAIGQDAIGSLPPIGATVDVGTEVTVILDEPSEDEDEEEE